MQTGFPANHGIHSTEGIWHPEAPRNQWAFVIFRSELELETAVSGAQLLVTASQRFALAVDGQVIARGPSRSDKDRWGVVAVELPELPAGKHDLTIRVWHAGDESAVAQMGPPAFLLCYSDKPELESWSTGTHWRCTWDQGRTPIIKHAWGEGVNAPYDVAGAGELVDCAVSPIDWPRATMDCEAKRVGREAMNSWGNAQFQCRLRPEPLPSLVLDEAQWSRLIEYADDKPVLIPIENEVEIAAGQTRRIVFDAGTIVNAWVTIHARGAKGRIQMVTAEAPSLETWKDKPPRDQIEGVRFRGHRDEIRPSGDSVSVDFGHWRSFRYLEMTITAADEPLYLSAPTLTASGFPLPKSLPDVSAKGPSYANLEPVIKAADETMRLCSNELFFDCPHYEQCQFPGDSFLMAQYHYALHGEERLGLKAIDDFHASRQTDGILLCRYPTRTTQVLPTFSLIWVTMLDDFRIWRGAEDLAPYLACARGVIEWFLRFEREDGMPGHIPWAPFIDWSKGFERGNVPQDADGGSSLAAFQMAYACACLARLERKVGIASSAEYWEEKADTILDAIRRTCWDSDRGLIADTPSKQSFSVHGQLWAIKTGLIAGSDAEILFDKMIADPSLIQPGTLAYYHYICEAAWMTGRGQTIIDLTQRWEQCLVDNHLTTLPETLMESTRSDCHGWSANIVPNLVTCVLGLRPNPKHDGCGELLWTPSPGDSEEISGTIHTPQGPASATMTRIEGNKWSCQLQSPVPVHVSGESTARPAGDHSWVAEFV